MYKGHCLCGSVKWEFDVAIESVTACNCTACRRYGVLWAYGHEEIDVRVIGTTKFYTRRENSALEFHFCENCGCLVSWRATKLNEKYQRRMAVNVRLIDDHQKILNLPIDHFDGFDTFEDLPRDERCVKHMWF